MTVTSVPVRRIAARPRRDDVVQIPLGDLVGVTVEVDVFDDEHRILKGQSGIHQPDVVGGGRGRHDPPARAGREDPAGSIRCCDPYPEPIATLVRSTNGTGLSPPNMCRALPIWLNT